MLASLSHILLLKREEAVSELNVQIRPLKHSIVFRYLQIRDFSSW